ncbi:protein asteroid homolog 1-like [Anneissia japonica]|uniref:protein asteroid homolog 1-like n=1 Tax=Anneissia japonica TaxID=1529436 RepID=UPI0014258C58|nr:protein asteroid homolog 1-like [Anneissia japonica]
MGVRGLTGFINKNNIFSQYELSNGTVIVDGYNFLYSLYFDEEIDVKHGGEYSDFYKIFNDFISVLDTCKVKPIFIFDGGHVDERKFPTIKERFEKNLKRSLRIGQGADDDRCILPLFCSHTMIKLFNDLNVCAVWCDFESDPEIAKIANEYRCPVLSADSDFYIMDLPNGFINTSDFQWKTATRRGIKCKIYYRSEFCRRMDILKECVPLVAAFAGNDFNECQMRIGNAITFLKGKTSADTAVNQALKRVNRDVKDRMKREIMSSLSTYDIPETSSTLAYLKNPNAEMPESALYSNFPPWFIALYRKGGVNKDSVDVVLYQQRFLNHYVEDETDSCADNASLSLRKWQYGILAKESSIKEYFREADKLTHKMVTPNKTSVEGLCVPNLEDMQKLSLEEREDWFFNFLETKKGEYENMPAEFHLPIAAFKFWLKHCKPEREYAFALLSSWIVAVNGRKERGAEGMATYKNPYFNLRASHAFSQWQSILKHTIYLNQLLMSPIFECDVTVLYSGRMIFSHLEKGKKEIKAYLQENVPAFSESAKALYDVLKNLIE